MAKFGKPKYCLPERMLPAKQKILLTVLMARFEARIVKAEEAFNEHFLRRKRARN